MHGGCEGMRPRGRPAAVQAGERPRPERALGTMSGGPGQASGQDEAADRENRGRSAKKMLRPGKGRGPRERGPGAHTGS